MFGRLAKAFPTQHSCNNVMSDTSGVPSIWLCTRGTILTGRNETKKCVREMYSKDLLATVDMRSYTVTFEKQSDFPSHSLVDTLTLHLLVHEDAQGRGTRNQGYLNYNC